MLPPGGSSVAPQETCRTQPECRNGCCVCQSGPASNHTSMKSSKPCVKPLPPDGIDKSIPTTRSIHSAKCDTRDEPRTNLRQPPRNAGGSRRPDEKPFAGGALRRSATITCL